MTSISKTSGAMLAFTLMAGMTAAPLDAIANALARARQELTGLQPSLPETRPVVEKSVEEQEAIALKLTDLTRANETLRQELEAEKARQKKALAKLDVALNEAAQLQAAHATAQAELTAAVKNAETLRKQSESHKAQLTTATAKLDRAAKDLTQAKEELTSAQKLLSDTKQALARNQTELAENLKAREQLEKEIAAEKALSEAAAKREQAAKEAARVLEQKFATLTAEKETELTKTRQELAATQKNLTDKQLTVAEMQRRLEAETILHREAVAKLEAAVQDGARMERELKDKADELLQANKDATQTQAKLNVAQKYLAKFPPAPARIVVSLPADARLTFDGATTTSLGGERVFYSPPIQVGRTYHYTIKAEVQRDGKRVTMEKAIAVHAGETTEVKLTPPDVESKGN